MSRSDNLFLGMFLGVLIMGFVAIMLILGVDSITSKERLVPEFHLVTDGKSVDTLYVYKLKN